MKVLFMSLTAKNMPLSKKAKYFSGSFGLLSLYINYVKLDIVRDFNSKCSKLKISLNT